MLSFPIFVVLIIVVDANGLAKVAKQRTTAMDHARLSGHLQLELVKCHRGHVVVHVSLGQQFAVLRSEQQQDEAHLWHIFLHCHHPNDVLSILLHHASTQQVRENKHAGGGTDGHTIQVLFTQGGALKDVNPWQHLNVLGLSQPIGHEVHSHVARTQDDRHMKIISIFCVVWMKNFGQEIPEHEPSRIADDHNVLAMQDRLKEAAARLVHGQNLKAPVRHRGQPCKAKVDGEDGAYSTHTGHGRHVAKAHSSHAGEDKVHRGHSVPLLLGKGLEDCRLSKILKAEHRHGQEIDLERCGDDRIDDLIPEDLHVDLVRSEELPPGP
mmetsp:Transcript_83214/g.169649  ORF Transcript_83214/g.169649 Transcript_83214/m.169649 type:complete len:324 (+) Transcript_83214:1131-2102(+)